MDTYTLKEILAQIREKDPSGFELLYRQFFRLMFSVAYSVLHNEEDSYDIIQSVMLRLYQLDKTRFPTGHELTWLKTVVRNEALMRLRRETITVSLEEIPELPVLDQKIEDFVDMDAFQSLTADLNERQRKVVSLKILGGMTHKEIAQMLALPIGTVQWLYAASLKTLRRTLTALTVLALAFAGGFGVQLYRYLGRDTQMPGDIGISGLPPVPPSVSPWLVIFPTLMLVAALAGVLLFKFSDRLPTKYFLDCI